MECKDGKNNRQRSKACIRGADNVKKMTPPQVAKELKLNEGTVYDWVRKYKADPANFMPGSGNQKPDDEKITKLQAENKRLKDEIVFLKNVTAYFAKDHGKNTL